MKLWFEFKEHTQYNLPAALFRIIHIIMLFELIKPQITTSEINHSALDIRSAEGREMFLGSSLSTYRYKCTMYELFVWISHFFGYSTSFDICKCFRLNCNFAPTIIKNSWWFFFFFQYPIFMLWRRPINIPIAHSCLFLYT